MLSGKKDQPLTYLRIPNPDKQEGMSLGFGGQMPAADSPYVHMMKEQPAKTGPCSALPKI